MRCHTFFAVNGDKYMMIRPRSFRCDDDLWEALQGDAKQNKVKVSDVIRERLRASMGIDYHGVFEACEAYRTGNLKSDLDFRLRMTSFMDVLLRGCVASEIMLDLHTGKIPAEHDVVWAEFHRLVGHFTD